MLDYSLLGERLAKIRKEKNYTQDKLAEKAKVSNNFISNIENNHSIPSLETLVKVCEALDITPNTLLLGANTEAESYMNDDISILLSQCTPQEKRYVQGIIKVLIAERE